MITQSILQKREDGIRQLQERLAIFQESIAPIIKELTILECFAILRYYPESGEFTREYPKDISELRSKYYELIKVIAESLVPKA